MSRLVLNRKVNLVAAVTMSFMALAFAANMLVFAQESSTSTPSAPRNLEITVVPGFPGEDSFILTWDPPEPADSGIIGYQILRRMSTSSPYAVLNSPGPHDPPLSTSTTYTVTDTKSEQPSAFFFPLYAVKAFNDAGASEPSDDVTVEPMLWPEPNAPQNLVVTLTSVQGYRVPELRWEAPEPRDVEGYPADSGINVYQILRRVSGSTNTYETHGTISTGTSYIDNRIEVGAAYDYAVKAINPSGASEPSNSAISPVIPPRVTVEANPPRNLDATTVWQSTGEVVIRLSWDLPEPRAIEDYPDDSGIVRYRILRRESGSTSTDDVLERHTVSTSTSYLDTDVQNGVSYDYTVKALNPAGASEDSNSATAAALGHPEAPRNLEVSAVPSFPGEVRFILTWDAPEPRDVEGYPADSAITGYKILRRASGWDYHVTVESDTGSTSATYTVTSNTAHLPSHNVVRGNIYSVKAINSAGVSDISNEVTATPNLLPEPNAPQNLDATAPGGAKVSLSWDAPEPRDVEGYPADSRITGYQILRREAGSTSTYEVHVEDTHSASTSYRDTDVQLGVDYEYAVKAINPAGTSEASDSDTAMPLARPRAPQNLRSDVTQGFQGEAEITFTWDLPDTPEAESYPADSGITKYHLLRRVTHYNPGEEPDLSADYKDFLQFDLIGTTTYTLTNAGKVPAHNYYQYALKAENAVGVGPVSEPTASSRESWPAPGHAPRNVRLTAVLSPESYGILLEWDAPAPVVSSELEAKGWYGYPSDQGITGYRIGHSVAGGWERTKLVSATTTSYLYTNLDRGSDHSFSVRAVNPAGISRETSSSIMKQFRVPGAPQNLGVTARSDGDEEIFTLSWELPNPPDLEGYPADSGITGYRILRRESGSQESYAVFVSDTNSTSTSYVVSVAATASLVVYEYVVKAINPAGAGQQSDSVTAIPSQPLISVTAVVDPNDTSSVALRLDWLYHNDGLLMRYGPEYRQIGVDTNFRGTQRWLVESPVNSGALTLNRNFLRTFEYVLGSEYEFRITTQLKDTEGGNPFGIRGPYSNTVSVTLDSFASVPPPKNLRVTQNTPAFRESQAQVILYWDAPSLPEGVTPDAYRFERAPVDEEFALLSNTGNIYFVDVTSTPGVLYKSRIILEATLDSGETILSEPSNEVTFTRVVWPVPNAPRDLTVTSAPGSGTADLSWEAPSPRTEYRDYPADSGVTGYRVLRRVSGSTSTHEVLEEDTGSTSTSYTDTSAQADVVYEYAIKAINPAGVSEASDSATTVRLSTPRVPRNLVSEVTQGFLGEGTITFTWDLPEIPDIENYPADSGITRYHLLRRVTHSSPGETPDLTDRFFELLKFDAMATTTYTITNELRRPELYYQYVLKAENAAGTSGASEPTTSQRETWPPPGNLPRNVRLSAIGGGFDAGNGILVEWDPPAPAVASDLEALDWYGYPTDHGITEYEITRSINGAKTETSVNSDITSHLFTGLSTGSSYEFTLAGVNPRGPGTASEGISMTAPTPWGVPNAPQNLTVSAEPDSNGGNSFILAWEMPSPRTGEWADYPADSGITGYQILRRDSGSQESYGVFVSDTNSTSTSYVVSSADSLVEYEYVVKAINPSGLSPESNSATAISSEGPTPPRLSLAITLSWEVPDNSVVSGYRVLRRESGRNQAYQQIAEVAGRANTLYTDTSAAPGVVYEYAVRAYNSTGESDPSNFMSDKRVEAMMPLPPQNLTGSASNGDVVLSWEDPGGGEIDKYQVLRRELDVELTLQVVATVSGRATTTYTDNSVSAGARYAYRVRAVNSAGPSAESNFVNVRVPSDVTLPELPGKPQSLSASVSDGNVVLSWDSPTNGGAVTTYRILRRVLKVGSSEFHTLADVSGATVTYTDTTATTGVRYAYRVRAVNAAGTGKPSNFVNVRP